MDMSAERQVLAVWASIMGRSLSDAGFQELSTGFEVGELARRPLSEVERIGRELQAYHPEQDLGFPEWLDAVRVIEAAKG